MLDVPGPCCHRMLCVLLQLLMCPVYCCCTCACLCCCRLHRGVPHVQRPRQLELLLSVDQQLGHRLTRAVNNNGATPLVTACSRIKDSGDAQVFSRLLAASDAAVLATPTKSGV
jgi:hypothetical protein